MAPTRVLAAAVTVAALIGPAEGFVGYGQQCSSSTCLTAHSTARQRHNVRQRSSVAQVRTQQARSVALSMSWLEDMFNGGSKEAQRVSSAEIQDAEIVEAPQPGYGVVDLKFKTLKTGGFKVWLFFWALGEGKQDLQNQFTVRETADGIRCFLTGSESGADVTEYNGVLDVKWGLTPSPFFRVDRIDPREEEPYPGELDMLCRLVDALMELYRDESTPMEDKLFSFEEERNVISDAKGKLAQLAAKWG